MKIGILGVSLVLFSAGWSHGLDRPSHQGKQGKPPVKAPAKVAVPTPPTGQDKPLPPVLEPARTAVERRDLMQRFKRRHVIEGFYRLTAMATSNGGFVGGVEGYLFLGQRHMSMQLRAPSATPGQANIQATVRTYRIAGNQLVMSSLLGHRNKRSGDIGLDKPGEVIKRRFQLVGAALRIHLGQSEYLEFKRLE